MHVQGVSMNHRVLRVLVLLGEGGEQGRLAAVTEEFWHFQAVTSTNLPLYIAFIFVSSGGLASRLVHLVRLGTRLADVCCMTQQGASMTVHIVRIHHLVYIYFMFDGGLFARTILEVVMPRVMVVM